MARKRRKLHPRILDRRDSKKTRDRHMKSGNTFGFGSTMQQYGRREAWKPDGLLVSVDPRHKKLGRTLKEQAFGEINILFFLPRLR